MRDVRGRHDADDLEVGGLDREAIEEADALAEEQRHEVDVDLVDQPGVEGLLENGGVPISTSFSPAASLAWPMALSMPSVTKTNGDPSRAHEPGTE